MSKKTLKKTTKPLSPKALMIQADKAYPVEQEELDEQQQRVRNAAAAGAGLLKTSASGMAEPLPTSPMVPAKPLTPLAALWPSSSPSPGESKPAQATTHQVQPAAVTAAAPKAPHPPTSPPPKPPSQSASATSPLRAAVSAQAPKPATPKAVSVSFALVKPGSNGVSLCGDFNGWSPSATPMKPRGDGRWETTIALAPGRHQYKFLVDGEWLLDPAAQKSVPNEYGSFNSVCEVRA